jgi:hypothetical protein
MITNKYWMIAISALLLAGTANAFAQSNSTNGTINILAGRDGVLVQKAGDSEFSVHPLISDSNGVHLAGVQPLTPPSGATPLTVNIFLPAANEEPDLFEPASSGGLIPRKTKTLASFRTLSAQTAQDIKVGEWDSFQVARFQVWGPSTPEEAANEYGAQLSPTCGSAGPIEGLWAKFDLRNGALGEILDPGGWTTVQQGTFARLVNSPSNYQFYWSTGVCKLESLTVSDTTGDIVTAVDAVASQYLGVFARAAVSLTGVDRSLAAYFGGPIYTALTTLPAFPAGDLTLSATPQSVFVKKGGTNTFDATINVEGTLTGPAHFSTSGLTESTVTFSPSSLTRSGTSKVTISVPNSTNLIGVHPFKLIAQGSFDGRKTMVTKSIDLILTVTW